MVKWAELRHVPPDRSLRQRHDVLPLSACMALHTLAHAHTLLRYVLAGLPAHGHEGEEDPRHPQALDKGAGEAGKGVGPRLIAD